MRHVLRFKCLHGRNTRVNRVAIVRAATTIKLAVFILWRPGAQITAPAAEFGLFVKVAVHQNRLRGVSARGRDFKKQYRRAALKPHDLQGQTVNLLRFHPACRVAHDSVDETVLRPVAVKSWRLGRNRNIAGNLADQVAIPLRVYLRNRLGSVKDVGGNFAVQGGVH